MFKNGVASSVEEAETVGDFLIDHGVYCHVTRSDMFENSPMFYRFAEDWPSSLQLKKRLTDVAASVLHSLRMCCEGSSKTLYAGLNGLRA